MSALLVSVIVASALGSLHCVAMCGPLVAVSGKRTIAMAVMHSLGRLVTYGGLGVAAGFAGRVLNVVVVQHVAAVAAGGVIVAMGVHAVAVARGWVRARGRGGALFARGLVQLRRRRPATRAYLMGMLTGLIPCGWLWAFVVSAAGTGSALAGAAVMGVFWLGTVPAMTGVLVLIGPVVERVRARMPVVTAVALMVLGLGTLAVRWNASSAPNAPSCHGGHR